MCAMVAELNSLRMAVGVHDDGSPLRDFHTVQTVPTAAVKRPDSRADALSRAGRKTNTTITLRDYRVGVLYSIALWGAPLALLRAALKRPEFTLYLGRKSCPLAAPPAPEVVLAEGPLEALGLTLIPTFRTTRDVRPPLRLIVSDDDLGGGWIERRNDVPLDRERWHFTSREVHFLRPALDTEEGGR